MTVYHSITELIGHTPLLELSGLARDLGLNTRILGKLECFNPGHSIKDRAALSMINDAEKRNLLKPGATIIEPTSGNTGIGLAMVARARGYKAILTMPETMSLERRKLLAAFGAEIVLTDGARNMQGAIEKAKELAKAIPGSFMPMQFDNPANAQAHFLTTGPEIWEESDHDVDIFVSSVGSDGTITGTGRYLKTQKPDVQIVAVEPSKSAVLSGKAPGPHGIQGIGAGFVPKVLDTSVLDEIVAVDDEAAFEMTRRVSRTDSILVGISSGAALAAAVKLSQREENAGKTIVVILPDSGERYLSTSLFDS